MAVSSASAPVGLSQPQLKSTSSTSEPVLRPSEGHDAPLSQATTTNGIAEQHNGPLHDLTGSDDPFASNYKQNAAGSAIDALQMSPAPVGGSTVPSINPAQGSETQEPRGTTTDKDGDKPGPSSPSAPSPAPSHLSTRKSSSHRANGNGHGVHTRQQKQSFLSKLFRVLIPCVSSSSSTHPIEDNDFVSLSGSKEKQPSASSEHVVSTSTPSTTEVAKVTTPLAVPVTAESSTLTPVEPASSVPDDLSPDAEVPIQPTPPSPPHLLPFEETEGVTSGAVQPPGSTGGSPKLEAKRHSGEYAPPSNASVDHEEDSEGTSFTEDEDIDGLDDVEDDEERLIMNGGAGIPVGPV
ncbi:hypothetical protein C0991_002764 [Blastosporella zonata]|nr:hypothetical protein C0991_002764 [Blastosporella zonata]